MNCANHPETPAAAYCRDCGKPLCPECVRRARGSVFCAEHAPAETPAEAAAIPLGTAAGFAPLSPGAASLFAPTAAAGHEPAASPYEFPALPASPALAASPYASPWTAPDVPARRRGGVPPVIALMLGFIPGVGAICNGQYAKGLIHAVIFGLLVSLVVNAHGLGPIIPFVPIMIAAWIFYMAFEAFHTAARRRRGLPVEEFSSLFEVHGVNSRLPLGAVLLVVVGFILLLDTTDIVSMEVFARYWPAGLIALGIYLLYARVHPAPARPVEQDAAHDLEGRQ